MDKAPDGNAWVHEIKIDGYRALVRVDGGRVRILTRQGLDWTDQFRFLAEAAATLRMRQAFLDGEVAKLDANGTTSFQALQNALGEGREEGLLYYAFDLLYLDGYDLTGAPLVARKALLENLLAAAPHSREWIRYSDHVTGRGEEFRHLACRHAVEGVVSKRADQPYRSGRSRDWLKTKCETRQEFVIGGFTEPAGSRSGFGALLLGLYDAAGRLIYAGRVGTGFTEQSLAELRERLARIETVTAPYAQPPSGASVRGVHWVKPELVAEVSFTSWTHDGLLRHPSFKGLREDKPAREVRERSEPQAVVKPNSTTGGRSRDASSPRAATRPTSRTAADTVAGVRLTHPDRLLYPEQGITKRELAVFYQSIAEWILPELSGRPLAIVRCPQGLAQSCFFQKHSNEAVPETIHRVEIEEEKGPGVSLMVDSREGLVSLAQIGALELHTWGSRVRNLERPDRIVFDLDPDPSVAWERVVDAARQVRDLLAQLGLRSYVKTTGGKGLHVLVPIEPRHGWDRVKGFAKAVAEALVRGAPDRYTAHMAKASRKGKIFIDYLRNGRGATTVAAYSTRAKPRAPVSTPVSWKELDAGVRPDQYTVRNLTARLTALKRDPWEGYQPAGQSITARLERELGQRGERRGNTPLP